MPNASGVNQLGSSHVPYGEARKMKQLADEAPMSGAPIATSALATPVRARRNPQGRKPQPEQELPPPMVPELAAPPQMPSAQQYAQIAAIPGASPLVQSIFGAA